MGNITKRTGQRKSERANNAKIAIGRRRLGKLEVSAVGLGVQNKSRKYETTVPYRPEMINIIRTAFAVASHFSTPRKRTVLMRWNVSSAKA